MDSHIKDMKRTIGTIDLEAEVEVRVNNRKASVTVHSIILGQRRPSYVVSTTDTVSKAFYAIVDLHDRQEEMSSDELMEEIKRIGDLMTMDTGWSQS